MKELIESVRALTGSEGVMIRLVLAVKTSNDLAKGNAQHLKWVSTGLILCTLLLIGVSVTLWNTVKQLEATYELSEEAIKKLDKTDQKVEDVKEQQKEAKEAEAEKPKVEIVPETDPEKAKVAPIKVRIIAPPSPLPTASASAAKSPKEPKEAHAKPVPPPTVELPLPLEDAAAQKKR